MIIGFVTNDTDMGDYIQKYVNFHKNQSIKPIRRLFPNAIDFIGEQLGSIMSRYSKDWGYRNWEMKLDTNENLEKYFDVLVDLSNFCQANNMKLLFVLTPNHHGSYFRNRYDVLIPYLEKANIEYLDLYPAVKRDLSKYSTRELKANPANGHPGDLVTEVYANEVFDYLKNMHTVALRSSASPL